MSPLFLPFLTIGQPEVYLSRRQAAWEVAPPIALDESQAFARGRMPHRH